MSTPGYSIDLFETPSQTKMFDGVGVLIVAVTVMFPVYLGLLAYHAVVKS